MILLKYISSDKLTIWGLYNQIKAIPIEKF